MCRDCGQFNVRTTTPVVRVQMQNGQEHVFDEQTVSRRNGHHVYSQRAVEQAYRAGSSVRLLDANNTFIRLDGQEITRVLCGTISRVHYQGELLHEYRSW